MKTMTLGWVAAEDLARALGGIPVSVALERARGVDPKSITEDALGRSVIAADVARKLVEEKRAEAEARTRDQAEFQVWVREREVKRREVVGKARKKAADGPLLGRSGLRREDRMREAGWEAGRRFDAKNPELGFEEWRAQKR